jgi:hypothetical protein
MYPYILDSFTGKTLFQLNKYYNLNLLNELFGVIIPHGFDMGNIGLYNSTDCECTIVEKMPIYQVLTDCEFTKYNHDNSIQLDLLNL